MKLFIKKNIFILLIVVCIFVGLFLRIYNLYDHMYFGFDQGRDFQRIEQIATLKNFKLLGPETYIPGLFNSPLYYYILTPIFVLSGGNPYWSIILLGLVNMGVACVLYMLASTLFSSRWVGAISVFLWSISFEQNNFARHLSQAPLAIMFTAIFYLGLAYFFLKNKKSGLLLSVVGLGLSVHSNIYFVYLVALYPILYLIYLPKIPVKKALLSTVALIGILSSFILAEIKFHFIGIKSLLMFMEGKQGTAVVVFNNLSNYIQKITEAVVYSFFSFNYLWAFLFLVVVVILLYNYAEKKNAHFLMLIALSTLPLFAYKSSILESTMINASIYVPLTLIVAASIFYLLKDGKTRVFGIVFLIVIVISNLKLFAADSFVGMDRIAYQNLTYTDETKSIDYTYSAAHLKPFSICTITNPLFVNTLWTYLYESYGQKKYGYIPTWSGQRQENNVSLPDDTSHTPIRYLIIEPMIGIPEIAKKTVIYMEDQVSTLQEEKQIGDIRIQKRLLKPATMPPQDSQHLSQNEIGSVTATMQSDPRYSCFQAY